MKILFSLSVRSKTSRSSENQPKIIVPGIGNATGKRNKFKDLESGYDDEIVKKKPTIHKSCCPVSTARILQQKIWALIKLATTSKRVHQVSNCFILRAAVNNYSSEMREKKTSVTSSRRSVPNTISSPDCSTLSSRQAMNGEL